MYMYINSLYNRNIETKPVYRVEKSPSKKKQVPTDNNILFVV